MITVAWVNYTAADKRGPQKKFVEYVIGLSQMAPEQVRVIAIFPFDTEDTKIFEKFDAHQIPYFNCPIARYSHLGSVHESRREISKEQILHNVAYMKMILEREKCDLVISNCSLVWEAGYAAKALGIKHVMFFRGIFNATYMEPNVLHLPTLRKYERDLLDLTDVAVTQSSYTARLWGLGREKMKKFVIPVGSTVEGSWVATPIEGNVLKVLVLSGLENYKNQLLVVDVAKALKDEGYQAEFNIYGSHKYADYTAEVEKKIEAFGLKDSVHIRDYDPDIDKLYKEHHVLFISSIMETFGVTACEAMGRCKPVISTRCGGPEDIIVDGVTGFLSDITDAKGLTQHFKKLIDQKELIVQMGEAGRKRWEQTYQMSVVLRQWFNLMLEQAGPKEMMREERLLYLSDQKSSVKNWLIVTKNVHSPGVHLGLENVLKTMQDQGKVFYKIVSDKTAMNHLRWSDVVVFARSVDKGMCHTLDEAKKMGKRTLYYVDDSLYEVPRDIQNGVFYNSEEAANALEYFAHETEMVITCSDWTAEGYKERFNCPTIWLPSAIKPIEIKPLKRKTGPIIIGFSGNVDYIPILEYLKPLLVNLHEKYGERLQFEIFGPKVSYIDQIKGIYYRPTDYHTYEVLLARRKWDIGFAYLEDTIFNNKKFYNKYLEYARLGIPGVYSDLELFRRVVKEGETGVLAGYDLNDWFNKIELLIENPELRRKIAINAKKDVENRFSIQKGIEQLQTKLGDFL